MDKIVKTDDELREAALVAGLKMFGLPNSRSYSHSPRGICRRGEEKCGQDMEKYGINPVDYEGIQEKHGTLSSGLIWGNFQIVRETLSERIKNLTADALENFLSIGTFEYIFYPYSPDKPLKDYSDTSLLLDPNLQDTDGNIYTCCGESSEIYVTEVDMDLFEAIGVYLDIAKILKAEGHYSQEEIVDILSLNLHDYGEYEWQMGKRKQKE